MFEIPYFSIVGRSNERPKPYTRSPRGSPMGSNISCDIVSSRSTKDKHETYRSEHAGIANFDPFAQAFVIPEYLHARFSVRIVGWLEAKAG